MSNATYKQDLHDIALAVATASKNYTDESIANLEWQIGTYNYDVATDSNVARIKTLPSDTYKSQIDYIGGKSVKYNQLIQNGNFVDTSGWNSVNGTTSVSNNELTYTFTSVLNDTYSNRIVYTKTSEIPDTNHKHLVLFDIYSTRNCSISPYLLSSNVYTPTFSITANQWTRCSAIVTMSAKVLWISLYNASDSGFTVGDTIKLRKVETIDLTNDFGAGNEPTSVDNAIPLLKANGYKLDGTDTYSVGDLKHAVVSGVKYEAVNLFDISKVLTSSVISVSGNTITKTASAYNIDLFTGTAGYATNIPSDFDLNKLIYLKAGTYYAKADFPSGYTIRLFVVNSDRSVTGVATFNGSFTINDDTYLTIRMDNNSAWSISNLMLVSGSTAPSTYIPYVAPITKAIPSQVLADVRYGLGFDNTNYNHLDSDGHLRGSWGIVDLGSSNDWSLRSGETHLFQCGDIRNIIKKPPYTNIKANIICTKYNETTTDEVLSHIQLSIAIFPSGYIGIYDENYSTVEAFKTAMSGAYLVYELETAFDQDYSQYFTPNWNKVDLDKQYATCEMVVAEPIDMPNSITNLIKEVKA